MVREDWPAGLPALLEGAVRRQPDNAKCSQGFAGEQRGASKGSAGSFNAPGSRQNDGDLSRKKTHIISKAYTGPVNPLRIIEARSSRAVLLPS